MTLEQAWNLIESLNDDANEKSKNLWLSKDVDVAIRYQSEYFKNNFLDMGYDQKQEIIHWIKNDEEFQDYVKCLAGNDFIINLF